MIRSVPLVLVLVAGSVAHAAAPCAPLVHLIETEAFDDPAEWGPALDRAATPRCVALISTGAAEPAERALERLHSAASAWSPTARRAIRARICAFGARAALDAFAELVESDPACAARQIERDDAKVANALRAGFLLEERIARALVVAPKAGPRGREQLALVLEEADEARLRDPARDRLHHALCDDHPSSQRLARACAAEGPDRVAGWMSDENERGRRAQEDRDRADREDRRERSQIALGALAATAVFFGFVLLFRRRTASRVALVAVGTPGLALLVGAMILSSPTHGGPFASFFFAALAVLLVGPVAGFALWYASRTPGAVRVAIAGGLTVAAVALSLSLLVR